MATKKPLVWKTVKVQLGKLKPWVRNPRESTQADSDGIGESLDEFGYSEVLLIGPGFELYDGHQRLPVMLQKYGPKHVVECRQSSRALTEIERRKLTAFLHAKATGRWNWDALSSWDAKELSDWGFDKGALKNWKTDVNALDKFLKSEQDGDGLDAEPQIDRAAELAEKWKTSSGQLWKLGEHRLLIGSSLERESWVRLCGEERATLTWTDPPYGVKYGDKLDEHNAMGYKVRTIENDDLPPDQLEEFVRTALKNCAEFSGKGAAIYVACPAGTLLPAIISAMSGSGYDYRWHLVWLKDQIVLSRADYHFKHENILYGWKPDGAHYFIDDRTQASVFEYPRPKKSEEHPTMKPVELVEHMIKNSSRVGDIVLEPFGGSGTTLLACERQKRICRVTELSEKYGAVILERFEQATGITPKLEGKTQRKSPK